MIQPIRTPHTTLGNGNGGIVPPWLQQPPIIVIPVEPGANDPVLPVEPNPGEAAEGWSR